jgi:predicted dehydrogenase
LKDNGETPDTQDALFDYPGFSATWSHREASRGAAPIRGMEFCGTKGSLVLSREGFLVTPDPKVAPAQAIPKFGGPHPVGGPSGTGEQASGESWTRALEDRSGNAYDQFRRHARHFLDCVKSRREPVSDLESGHRVATTCHLANLSLRLGRTLAWDASKETVTGDAEAALALERPYRAPWDAEKIALLR